MVVAAVKQLSTSTLAILTPISPPSRPVDVAEVGLGRIEGCGLTGLVGKQRNGVAGAKMLAWSAE